MTLSRPDPEKERQEQQRRSAMAGIFANTGGQPGCFGVLVAVVAVVALAGAALVRFI